MQDSLFRLDGQVALVTGCRRGIGQAMADALAEAGADIVGISASLNPDSSEVGDVIRRRGRRFSGFRCDLSDRNAVDHVLEQVLSQHPVIDVLVNNAGIVRRAPAEKHSDELWDTVLEVNLSAQFRVSRRIGTLMLERGKGSIISTASILSDQGGLNVASYAASKAGLANLTRSLANEWAGRGVRVNAIAPGYVKTEMTEALQSDPLRSRQILERIPAGRLGSPDDLRGPVVFLASDASRYVHGETLVVDGGWMGR
ncbi:short chain dehydrogenase family protein [Synechococcus sp. MIT S9220]|uniref:SDR family oxidoreductase n=1 Tax=unclassified Synechococcus TaxID=2626047 RepID=UPI00164C3927|nr:SDR family oxidoreductase [Synechococcus sp. MIT S9220]NOL46822.1 SDR family oxidoreductase [Synechococcus sp. MIT S9220]QNJ22943.1 short chain dehydrogenase family protein [Synechococcus sp. MIT S9220]|tara:strand:- start:149 stop:916 length:768 start_codon:yes stop_codon:yes gene_type:complete